MLARYTRSAAATIVQSVTGLDTVEAPVQAENTLGRMFRVQRELHVPEGREGHEPREARYYAVGRKWKNMMTPSPSSLFHPLLPNTHTHPPTHPHPTHEGTRTPLSPPPGPRFFGTHTPKSPCLGEERRAGLGQALPAGSPIVGSRVQMILRPTHIRAGRRAACRNRRHHRRREGANLDQFRRLRDCFSLCTQTPSPRCASRSIALREEANLPPRLLPARYHRWNAVTMGFLFS